MDVKEYREKQAAMESTAAQIDAAHRRLTEAVKQLADWKTGPAPKLAHAKPGSLHVAEWPSLDEINKLIERYWQEREEVKQAWDALPEEIREVVSLVVV